MNLRTACLLLCCCPLLAAATSSAAGPEYDLVIRNGHLIDGTGSPWYAADIAVKDGRIVSIGQLADVRTKRSIDAHGMVVAPGFI
ncbi:MAG: D-aminoacylase, partial [Luteimonas sp.]